jgi:hypothetical protein
MNSIVLVGDGDGLYEEKWNLSGDRRVSIVLRDFNCSSERVWVISLEEQELVILPKHAPEFTSSFSGVRVARSLVLCVCFVDRCLSFCPFFVWPLQCLSFCDLRIRIILLVSLNSSKSIELVQIYRNWIFPLTLITPHFLDHTLQNE